MGCASRGEGGGGGRGGRGGRRRSDSNRGEWGGKRKGGEYRVINPIKSHL